LTRPLRTNTVVEFVRLEDVTLVILLVYDDNLQLWPLAKINSATWTLAHRCRAMVHVPFGINS